ncbi:MAG: alanine--tRNA ligase [Bacteroidota bacterium]|nr:alanine--tRNA ligase [Bacteroidota bacterium]MDP4236012.1 alanine--tRNA ligase [Bacteroidota bacterium]
MTSQEIRQSFLNFFRERGHTIVPSAPVIPHGDKTLLFTNAGMNQFKDVFLGEGTRPYTRCADTQKCIRVSGKHNDLEEVGRDTYHHTLFEMLGNWSFGDYYKKEAIAWAWELLTKVWGLDKSRLYATVFETDTEAETLWGTVTDIDPSHILRFGPKDNFWEMGETGPCGPCSEIHYDKTPDKIGGKLVNAGTPDVIEIWNLVFIQHNRNIDGVLEDLPQKHVDTGMGFERVTAVMQGKASNYDTDIFSPYIKWIEANSGIAYGSSEETDIAMRVLSDHVRTLSCAIADGALPGNEGRGYVLRRVLRRAARYGRKLDFRKPFICELSSIVVQTMGGVFPELKERREHLFKVILGEEESFNATLDRGLSLFDEIALREEESESPFIGGEEAFKLYDTFGFPIDLTQVLAHERGLSVDMKKFDELLTEQKNRSKLVHASKKHREIATTESVDVESKFTGYDSFEDAGSVLLASENLVVLDRTPFYAESGGQISDTGVLVVDGNPFHVTDVRKLGGAAIAHIIEGEGSAISEGSRAIATIDRTRRYDIMRNHSATHLLHSALRQILGEHVHQAGSLVTENRLRFDFAHYQKVAAEELHNIEELVNDKIREAIKLQHHRNIPFEEAKKMGALMFFGDKYGSSVNVVDFGPFSREFCGGTHVQNTSEIGLLKLISESSIASGTRRIEAVTGRGVEKWISDQMTQHDVLLSEREQLEEEKRKLEKEIAKLKINSRKSEAESIIKSTSLIEGTRFNAVATEVRAANAEEFKSFAELLQSTMGDGKIIVLGTKLDGNASLIALVSDDIVKEKKVVAGKLVGLVSEVVGGKGGGRPNFAQAGGKHPERLTEALSKVPEFIRAMSSQ